MGTVPMLPNQPRISGLSRDEQSAYIAIIADLKAKPDLDAEVARAADWLMQKLQGRSFDELRLCAPFARAA